MSWSTNYNKAIATKNYNYKRESMAANIEAKQERLKNRAKLNQKRYWIGNYFKANILFKCQLYRGDEKYPRIEYMTVFQMFKANKKLRQSFMKKLETDSGVRLWDWRTNENWKHIKSDFCDKMIGHKKVDESFLRKAKEFADEAGLSLA